MKHVVFFSGGLSSFIASKRVIERFGKDNTELVFTDTLIEDPDLYTFMEQVEGFLGVEVTKIADGRTPWEVYKDEKFLGNSRIDPCSKILKRQLSDKWVKENYPDPENVTCWVGISIEEKHRLEKLAPRKLPYVYDSPLLWKPWLTSKEVRESVEQIGLMIPRLYKMGFAHNNCGGFCCKAGVGHFKNLYKKLPGVYKECEEQELKMVKFIKDHSGNDVSILRRQRKGVKYNLTLKQLREEMEQNIQTSLFDIEDFDLGGCGCFSDPD